MSGTVSSPLSRMQQRLVFIGQTTPDQPLYQIPTAFRLRGKIDATLLEKCLHEITARHEVLLGRIDLLGETPAQVVDRSVKIPLERISVASEAELEKLLHARSNRPMDVTKGPLVEFSLITLSDEDHVLFFMPHHVVWDGASLEIFLKELDALYANGGKSELPALPLSYGEFARWHEDWVRGEGLDEEKKFWVERLAGNIPSLDLPADRPRPPRMSYAGKTAWWKLDKSAVDALTKLGQEAGVTFYMVLLGAYVALLHRWSGQRDIVVGTPVRGRSWRRTQGLIGMFVNTLMLRVPVDPDVSFVDLLKTVKGVVNSSLDHPNMPLDVLVRELNAPRDPSRSPIAQAFLSFRDVRDVPPKLLGVEAKEIPLHTDFETQDLTLWPTQTNDGVSGVLTYSTDLFDHGTMESFLDHYQRFLAEVARDPAVAIGKVRIVSDAELAKLDSFNATRVDFPREACVHDLISAQAKKTPDAIAVFTVKDPAGGVAASITYREFEERTNRLAQYLRSLGVRREVRVGLSLARTIDLVVAQVAILKAGGAYVPLDPTYPKDRLVHMIEDSSMTVLVTESAIEPNLPETSAKRVRIDADAAEIAKCSADPPSDPDAAAKAESLAYCIYTSGSTGKPKGVLVPHRPLVNFILSMQKIPGIGPSDVVLAVTTLSFDIAVFDTLTALASGSKVLMASNEMTGDGELLKQAIEKENVTLLNATPATWRLLLAAGWNGAKTFRAITAGEALPKDLAIELVKRCHSVWDLYGPTETTVWSTYWEAKDPVTRILVGHPIDNTEVHVLDAYGQRTPIGVVGEIVIAGDGVTNGYLNRPELTEERFIPDPFRAAKGEANARMYRTGDLGRWLATGELEYLGRRDTQVKLRGFRIELGEIEAVLAQHPAVAEAVAAINEDDPTNPALVAYVVTRPGESWTATELRKAIRSKLPPYMVPQHVVEMKELPLTPAGKVDRRNLPPPFGKIEPERVYVAPADERERVLADLWAELLRVPRVSTTDNFFDLGGHSMLSLVLVARIEEKTGTRLNPRVLLASSLAQVAAMLPKMERDAPPPERVSAPPPSSEAPKSLRDRLLGKIGKKIFGR